MFSNSFFESLAVYEITWKNIVERGNHGWQYNMAHAHGMLDN